jgi:hypothetical protein
MLLETVGFRVVIAQCPCKILGGHLKTGHAWTSQNRPWRVAEDRFCFTLPQ